MTDIINPSNHKEALVVAVKDASYQEILESINKARRFGDSHDLKVLSKALTTDYELKPATYDLDICRQKPWISLLTKTIAALNNCVVVIANRVSNKQNISYEFKGLKNDTELCVDMLTYLVDTAVQRLQNDIELMAIKGVAMRNQYLMDMSLSIIEDLHHLLGARQKKIESNGSLAAIKSKKETVVNRAYGKPRYKDYYLV